MLALDRLTRRFGDLTALDALSFSVRPGEMFGFVGSNGAGKTTAMRLVMGVDDPDEGEVRWRGAPIDRRARSGFGYMPEERGLYAKAPPVRQLTYLARLHGLGRAEAAGKARRWMRRFGLEERMDEPLEKLSLGNQQRVQLAAALVHRPTLLVLDEPFSGLDPSGVDALSDVLREQVADGVAVVFSSHQLELVERLCDSVAIIHAGRLVASGTLDELCQDGRRLLRVGMDGVDSFAWADDLAGVEVVSRDAATWVFELAADVDDQVAPRCGRPVARTGSTGRCSM